MSNLRGRLIWLFSFSDRLVKGKPLSSTFHSYIFNNVVFNPLSPNSAVVDMLAFCDLVFLTLLISSMETSNLISDMVDLDGKTGEGGGQVVRIALALSAILKIPLRIHHVRGNRTGRVRGGGKSKYLTLPLRR